MKSILLVAAVIVGIVAANAQQDELATLLQKLKHAPRDTSKVELLYSISRKYWGRNNDSVILMAIKGIELADSIQFKKGKALNFLSVGVGLAGNENYPGAIKYYLECLKLSEELHMEGLSGNVYTNLGIAYLEHGNLRGAIDYFGKALKIAEQFGEAATCAPLINLSDLHTQTGEYTLAKTYARRALKISNTLGDSSNLAISLFNISEIYRKTNNNDSARFYLKQSLAISTHIGDFHGVAYCLNSMAEIALNEGKYQDGILLANQGLMNMNKISNERLSMSLNHLMYECHYQLDNYKEALRYRNQEMILHENIFNIQKEHDANNILNQHNLDLKELEIQLLEKDNKLQQEEIAKASLIKTIYGVGAIVLAILVIYLVRTNLRWKNYNRIVEDRNALIINQKATMIDQKIHLERLNSVKDRIISIISHDFRSPLTTLHGFLQLLKMDVLDKQEKANTIDRIEQNLSLTSAMVENLLAWASGQRGGLILNPVHFNLEELVAENIQFIRSRAEEKKISLTNEVAEGTSILADRDTINIVLRNLISNAIKFSRPNDSVFIAAKDNDDCMVVEVRDTGIGIDEAKLKILFDATMNTTTVGTGREKGTGLGLALCKELIQQQGGKIWAESQLGSGSVFFFSIPHSNAG